MVTKPKTGCFITIEGGEGAGKSTLIRHLESYLREKGLNVTVTREPGGVPIAEHIRAVILDKNHLNMDGRTEALLYAAARRQHLVEKVLPALERGEVVLCDRFVDSSLAYQGHARGLGIEAIYQINQFAIETAMPDLTLWLDLPPERGLERIRLDKAREINRLDLETLAFHQKVREGYELAMNMFPDRIRRINADQPVDGIVNEAKQWVEQALNRQESPRSMSN